MQSVRFVLLFFFFFNDTATTEIYTLSLHDALPISSRPRWSAAMLSTTPTSQRSKARPRLRMPPRAVSSTANSTSGRSEEHTSELQSRQYLVCRLLLEKKKKK